MNFDRLAGMLAAVGIVLILTMIAWLGIAGPIWKATWTATPDQWLGFVATILGSLITGGVAAIAIYFAWRGIMRQSKFALIAREEDWIAAQLPGLRDAFAFCGQVLFASRAPSPYKVVRKMFKEIFEFPYIAIPMLPHIERLLPKTNDQTRKTISFLLTAIDSAAVSAETLSDTSDSPELYVQQVKRLDAALYDLAEYSEGLGARIDVLESRLPRLRLEIEDFFDRRH